MAEQKDGKHERLWDLALWEWLFSLQIGVFLMAVVAVASIYGSLIEELKHAQEIVYYSWWYRLLLLLLAANVSCTTVRTAIERILPFRVPRLRQDPKSFKNAAPSLSTPYSGDVQKVEAAFQQAGFKTRVVGASGCAWKGLNGRWGSPISHMGIVVILIGGFASAWTAREGMVALREGERTSGMMTETSGEKPVPLGFEILCDDFDTDVFPKTSIPSKFISTLRVYKDGQLLDSDRVEVNHSMHAEGWTIHQTSREELKGESRFAFSVRHKNDSTSTTLELSPGQTRPLPGRDGTVIALSDNFPLRWRIESPGEKTCEGELASSPAGGSRIQTLRFEPDFFMDSAKKQIGSRSDHLNNPALQIAVVKNGQTVSRQWLFAREELRKMMHGQEGPYQWELTTVRGQASHWEFDLTARDAKSGQAVQTLTLGLNEDAPIGFGAESQPAESLPASKPAMSGSGPWTVRLERPVLAYRTVLSLNRNAAIPFIYLGCAITMLGLLFAFAIPRRQVWFLVDDNKKTLHVAAVYRHPQAQFDSKTQRVVDSLSGSPAAGADKG